VNLVDIKAGKIIDKWIDLATSPQEEEVIAANTVSGKLGFFHLTTRNPILRYFQIQSSKLALLGSANLENNPQIVGYHPNLGLVIYYGANSLAFALIPDSNEPMKITTCEIPLQGRWNFWNGDIGPNGDFVILSLYGMYENMTVVNVDTRKSTTCENYTQIALGVALPGISHIFKGSEATGKGLVLAHNPLQIPTFFFSVVSIDFSKLNRGAQRNINGYAFGDYSRNTVAQVGENTLILKCYNSRVQEVFLQFNIDPKTGSYELISSQIDNDGKNATHISSYRDILGVIRESLDYTLVIYFFE